MFASALEDAYGYGIGAQELTAELRRLVLAQTDLRAAAKALQGVPRAADDDVRWERRASALVACGRPFKNATLRLRRVVAF